MHTHIVTLLDEKFKNSDQKKIYQEKSLKKINNNIQGRVFDDFDLWDETEIAELCKEYNSIYEAVLQQAQQSSAFKKIQNKDSVAFASSSQNPHYNSWRQWIDNIVNSTDINLMLTTLITKIATRGCRELLDGYGYLNKDIMKTLNWNIFTNVKNEIEVEAVIFSHYHATIAVVQPKIYENKDKTTAGFHLIYFAMTQWLNTRADEVVQDILYATQKMDFYRQFASQFVWQLAKFKTSLMNYIPFLKQLIQDDIRYYESGNIRGKKLSFWINVMFESGVVNQQHDFLIALWPAFRKIVIDDPDFKNISSNKNINFIDEATKNRFLDCDNLVKQLTPKPAAAETKALDVKPVFSKLCFEDMIRVPLGNRDKNIIVDEIVNEYFVTLESERVKEELLILRELMMTGEGITNTRLNVREMLDRALLQCTTDELKNGPLAKILNKHNTALSAPQPWHDLMFAKAIDLNKEDTFITTLTNLYHRVFG